MMDLNKLLLANVIVGIVSGLISAVSTLITEYSAMAWFDVLSIFTVGVLIKAVLFFIYTAAAYPIIKFIFKRLQWWQEKA